MARRQRRNEDTTDISSADVSTALLRREIMPELDVTVSPVDNFLGDAIPADRRVFSFHEPEVYSLDVPQTFAPAVTRSERAAATIPSQVAFTSPNTVAVCVRRQQRREVLFAKGKTRARTRRQRRWYSDIKC